MKSSLALFSLFFLSLASCSTTAKITSSADLPQLSPTAVGAVIPFKLDTTGVVTGEDGCSLSLRKDDELKNYDINFKPGQDNVFAELPIGIYRFEGITCGLRRWDFTFKKWPRFQVFQNSISIVSGFSIRLNTNRNMSINLDNRESNREQGLKFFDKLSPAEAGRVVSAYTDKSILATNLKTPARWKNWEIKNDQEKNIKTKNTEWPSFRLCYRNENEVNGLWLGHLQMRATYEAGNLLKLEPADVWNTFSTQFIECATSMTKGFHPHNPAHITYTLYL